MYIYIYQYIYIHISIHKYISIYMHIYQYIDIYVYQHTHISTHIHISMHIHIHISIHRHRHIYNIFFVYSSISGYFGFHILATVNNVVMNMGCIYLLNYCFCFLGITTHKWNCGIDHFFLPHSLKNNACKFVTKHYIAGRGGEPGIQNLCFIPKFFCLAVQCWANSNSLEFISFSYALCSVRLDKHLSNDS